MQEDMRAPIILTDVCQPKLSTERGIAWAKAKVPTSAPQAKIEVANESLLSKYDVKITADDKNMKPNPVPVMQDEEFFNKQAQVYFLRCVTRQES